MNCTRCGGTGFLNLEGVDAETLAATHEAADRHELIRHWIDSHSDHNVEVCDCCGDGEDWHSEPGVHDGDDFGPGGPYAYNGGLPECS